jgi:hypothetical protein
LFFTQNLADPVLTPVQHRFFLFAAGPRFDAPEPGNFQDKMLTSLGTLFVTFCRHAEFPDFPTHSITCVLNVG